jgi:hypothetical protein
MVIDLAEYDIITRKRVQDALDGLALLARNYHSDYLLALMSVGLSLGVRPKHVTWEYAYGLQENDGRDVQP